MVYVGKNLPSGDGWNVEPALINPDLDIEEPGGLSDCDVDYGLRTTRITPRDRGAYLEVVGGRTARSNCDIVSGQSSGAGWVMQLRQSAVERNRCAAVAGGPWLGPQYGHLGTPCDNYVLPQP